MKTVDASFTTYRSVGMQEDQIPVNDKALEMAYKLAVDSYGVLQKRVEAMDTRYLSLVTWFSSIYGLLLTLIATKSTVTSYCLTSWLIIPVLAFIGGAYCAMHGLHKTGFNNIDPGKFDNNWLNSSENKFRYDAIILAGEAFTTNNDFINDKYNWAVRCTIFYLTGFLCLMSYLYSLSFLH
jgi:hypothetical protein